ncbi:MAG: GNAT family N-acetyltransferase [Lysobacteraceae bacterium]
MDPTDDLPITERLRLRRFTPDDLDFLCTVHSDPEVMRYVGGVKNRAQSEELLHGRVLAYYDAHPGLGCWMTIERATGAAIGLHILNHIRGETHIQVGYVLARPFWRRGYATEMSIALLRYGFTQLKLAQITAITDLPNLASQHVLAKSGLRRNGERSFADPILRGDTFAWFERDADDWLTDDRAHRIGKQEGVLA